jgi:hypothetical protein
MEVMVACTKPHSLQVSKYALANLKKIEKDIANIEQIKVLGQFPPLIQ